MSIHYRDTRNASSELTEGSLRNHFLIAMPGLKDTAFAHTITYICEHGSDGAMGVVVNNALPIDVGEILEQMELSDQANIAHHPVLAGGPVQTERGFVLHTGEHEFQSTLAVSPRVKVTSSKDVIEALAGGVGPDNFLIALGYAGWEPGQLEQEIANNAWLTLPADPDILFKTPMEQRWALASRQLGVDLNLISSTAGHA
ncbi:YqgE/AlgH family protein [Marinimicrobium alkaliphilum]|uniref:YqgE/AlgH family protein n=1 Tax=Marinimicrobium alkaliphilum TaxID=2202654 RepID=UPI000DBAD826|nr:YqgE/AlgH family protein [Marinimicrobium alkaliphilum]